MRLLKCRSYYCTLKGLAIPRQCQDGPYGRCKLYHCAVDFIQDMQQFVHRLCWISSFLYPQDQAHSCLSLPSRSQCQVPAQVVDLFACWLSRLCTWYVIRTLWQKVIGASLAMPTSTPKINLMYILCHIFAFWHPICLLAPYAITFDQTSLAIKHPICLLAPPFHLMCMCWSYDKRSSQLCISIIGPHCFSFLKNTPQLCQAAKKNLVHSNKVNLWQICLS